MNIKINKMWKLFATILVLLIFTSLVPIKSNAGSKEKDVVICPGKGERCARVYVLGIGLWWLKKEPGGPGIIIKKE